MKANTGPPESGKDKHMKMEKINDGGGTGGQ